MTWRPAPYIRASLFCALFLPAAAVPVRGSNLVEFTPTFSLTGHYNDNLDFAPTDQVSDFYTRISPGLSMLFNLSELTIYTNYVYTRYQYSGESDRNRDYHNFVINVPYGLQVTRNLRIEVENRYELVPINVTLPEEQPDNLTQRNIFTVGPVWESRPVRNLGLTAGYEFSRVDYTSSVRLGDDYFGHRFYETLRYDFTRNLSFFQTNSFLLRHYSRSPDYRRFKPEAGLRADLGKRLAATVSGGYTFDKTGDDRREGFVYSVTGNWEPTRKVDLRATFRQRRTVDIQGLPYTEQFYELLCRYRATNKLVLETSGRYYDDTYRGSDYRRIQYRAALDYRLNRWSSLNSGYVRNQTVDTPADDRVVSNRVYAGVRLSFGTY